MVVGCFPFFLLLLLFRSNEDEVSHRLRCRAPPPSVPFWGPFFFLSLMMLLMNAFIVPFFSLFTPKTPPNISPRSPTTTIVNRFAIRIKFAGIHSTPTKYGPTSSPTPEEIGRVE